VSELESRTIPRPPRLLADENLEGVIVREALRKRPGMAFLTASEAGTLKRPDLEVLNRARVLDLIHITHDRQTMSRYFGELLMGLQEDQYCPGIFIASQIGYSIGQSIDAIVEVYDLSSQEEWRNQIRDLPL
jgi:hypothetical protein